MSFSMKALQEALPPPRDQSVVWQVHNAHKDDIHGLIRLGDRTYVTGSKDGTLACWSQTGGQLWTYPEGPSSIDYRMWVTALATIDDTSWVHGTRDGKMVLWKNDCTMIKRGHLTAPAAHACKERNYDRIMCLTSGAHLDPTPSFLVGQACSFKKCTISGSISENVQASANDWVYVLKPIPQQERMLTVTGPDLSVWNKNPEWHKEADVQKTPSRNPKSPHRPYISSLEWSVDHRIEQIAASVFDGSVRLFDLPSNREVQSFDEHRGRVWSVVRYLDNVLVSSADDRSIKAWDIRTSRRSILTIQNHPGRVSSLLVDDHLLVAATCPDDLRSGQGAADLITRDLRNVL